MSRVSVRILLFLVPALVGVGVLSFVTYWLASGHDGAPRRVATTPVPLSEWVIAVTPTPRKTPFSACIESSTPANPQLVTAALEEIEAKLALWPGHPTGKFDGAHVVLGCPPEMLSRADENSWHEGPREDQFQLFISVLPFEKFRTKFGDRLYAEHHETYCHGDACVGETTGIYVASLDQKVLFEGIVDALGLIQALYQPTATPQAPIIPPTS